MSVNGFDKLLGKVGAGKPRKQSSESAIIRELTMIAEEACNKARNEYPDRASGGYDDHTRNLRGSICATIYHFGKEIKQVGFDGVGSAEGEANAVAAANIVSADEPSAIWEIKVTAGMYYARFVEAKGHTVLYHVQSWLTEQMNALAKDIRDGKI